MKTLLEELVRAIVDHKDSVVVEEETGEDGFTALRLMVHPKDMGRVIGKEGKIVQALRTLLRVAALNQGKRVRVDLVEAQSQAEVASEPAAHSEKQEPESS